VVWVRDKKERVGGRGGGGGGGGGGGAYTRLNKYREMKMYTPAS